MRTAGSWLRVALPVAPLLVLAIGAIERRWMSDDGFINLRVVRNLLEGHGPVFNPGERVEAVTSQLWVGVLAAAGALGAPLPHAAVWLGIALGLIGAIAALRGALDLWSAPRPVWRSPCGGWQLPIGAAIFCSLHAAWDFLSSGLENGLAYFWIGTSFATVAGRARAADDHPNRPVERSMFGSAVLVGLGPLVRPELAVASAGFLLVLAAIEVRAHATRSARRIAFLFAAALALPVASQLFRMGYYAGLSPNTALAKEAWAANWQQGVHYLENFLGTYRLLVPLCAALVVWGFALWALRRARRRFSLLAMLVPVVGGVAYAVYVVRVGGDFMHGRLLLAPTFLALAPVWSVPLSVPGQERAGRGKGLLGLRLRGSAIVLVAAWSLYCIAALRMPAENEHGIGNERRWYSEVTGSKNPIEPEDYRGFTFQIEGEALLQVAGSGCAGGKLPPRGVSARDCARFVYIDHAYEPVSPDLVRWALEPRTVHPEVVMVAARVPVGLIGYMLGSRVHLVDRLGLGDPIGARLELFARGRPGHEKLLTNPWIIARFTPELAGEDPRVSSARRALGCGALAELERAVRAPLDGSRFFANLVAAPRLARLRVPVDAQQAEARSCGARLD
jgi:arabinofuranosyltransferase